MRLGALRASSQRAGAAAGTAAAQATASSTALHLAALARSFGARALGGAAPGGAAPGIAAFFEDVALSAPGGGAAARAAAERAAAEAGGGGEDGMSDSDASDSDGSSEELDEDDDEDDDDDDQDDEDGCDPEDDALRFANEIVAQRAAARGAVDGTTAALAKLGVTSIDEDSGPGAGPRHLVVFAKGDESRFFETDAAWISAPCMDERICLATDVYAPPRTSARGAATAPPLKRGRQRSPSIVDGERSGGFGRAAAARPRAWFCPAPSQTFLSMIVRLAELNDAAASSGARPAGEQQHEAQLGALALLWPRERTAVNLRCEVITHEDAEVPRAPLAPPVVAPPPPPRAPAAPLLHLTRSVSECSPQLLSTPSVALAVLGALHIGDESAPTRSWSAALGLGDDGARGEGGAIDWTIPAFDGALRRQLEEPLAVGTLAMPSWCAWPAARPAHSTGSPDLQSVAERVVSIAQTPYVFNFATRRALLTLTGFDAARAIWGIQEENTERRKKLPHVMHVGGHMLHERMAQLAARAAGGGGGGERSAERAARAEQSRLLRLRQRLEEIVGQLQHHAAKVRRTERAATAVGADAPLTSAAARDALFDDAERVLYAHAGRRERLSIEFEGEAGCVHFFSLLYSFVAHNIFVSCIILHSIPSIGVGPSRDFFCSVGLRLAERAPKREAPLWVEEDVGHAHGAFVALSTGLHPFPINPPRVVDVALRMSQGWIARASAATADAAADAITARAPGAAAPLRDGGRSGHSCGVDAKRVARRFRLFGRLCGKALQDGHILAVAPSMPFLALVCGEIAPAVPGLPRATVDDDDARGGDGHDGGDELWLQLPQAIPPQAKHGVSIAVLWFVAISVARIERSCAGSSAAEQRAALAADTLTATIARVCSSNAKLRAAIASALPPWVFAPTMTVALFLETYSDRYGRQDPFSGRTLVVPPKVPRARASKRSSSGSWTSSNISGVGAPIVVPGAKKRRGGARGARGAHETAFRKRPRAAVRSIDTEDSSSDDECFSAPGGVDGDVGDDDVVDGGDDGDDETITIGQVLPLIRALGRWLLRDGVALQADAFRVGLAESFDVRMMRAFSRPERRRLICGERKIVWDFKLLRRCLSFSDKWDEDEDEAAPAARGASAASGELSGPRLWLIQELVQ